MAMGALLKLTAQGRGKREQVFYYVYDASLKPPFPKESNAAYFWERKARASLVEDLSFWYGATRASRLEHADAKLRALGWQPASQGGWLLADRLISFVN